MSGDLSIVQIFCWNLYSLLAYFDNPLFVILKKQIILKLSLFGTPFCSEDVFDGYIL